MCGTVSDMSNHFTTLTVRPFFMELLPTYELKFSGTNSHVVADPTTPTTGCVTSVEEIEVLVMRMGYEMPLDWERLADGRLSTDLRRRTAVAA